MKKNKGEKEQVFERRGETGKATTQRELVRARIDLYPCCNSNFRFSPLVTS